ncbi:tRNA (uridine(34)/cytosine(34)/5-carboxymethylaminomethyluridine(34)-2'-O)-methyltransferase TrmL, partial [Acinetobacter baumannii]
MRLASCLGLGMDLIEPCGFVLDDRRLRRSGLDYLAGLDLTRHASWPAFLANRGAGRLVLLTTQGAVDHLDFAFAAGDTLLLGRESA